MEDSVSTSEVHYNHRKKKKHTDKEIDVEDSVFMQVHKHKKKKHAHEEIVKKHSDPPDSVSTSYSHKREKKHIHKETYAENSVSTPQIDNGHKKKKKHIGEEVVIDDSVSTRIDGSHKKKCIHKEVEPENSVPLVSVSTPGIVRRHDENHIYKGYAETALPDSVSVPQVEQSHRKKKKHIDKEIVDTENYVSPNSVSAQFNHSYKKKKKHIGNDKIDTEFIPVDCRHEKKYIHEKMHAKGSVSTEVDHSHKKKHIHKIVDAGDSVFTPQAEHSHRKKKLIHKEIDAEDSVSTPQAEHSHRKKKHIHKEIDAEDSVSTPQVEQSHRKKKKYSDKEIVDAENYVSPNSASTQINHSHKKRKKHNHSEINAEYSLSTPRVDQRHREKHIHEEIECAESALSDSVSTPQVEQSHSRKKKHSDKEIVDAENYVSPNSASTQINHSHKKKQKHIRKENDSDYSDLHLDDNFLNFSPQVESSHRKKKHIHKEIADVEDSVSMLQNEQIFKKTNRHIDIEIISLEDVASTQINCSHKKKRKHNQNEIDVEDSVSTPQVDKSFRKKKHVHKDMAESYNKYSTPSDERQFEGQSYSNENILKESRSDNSILSLPVAKNAAIASSQNMTDIIESLHGSSNNIYPTSIYADKQNDCVITGFSNLNCVEEVVDFDIPPLHSDEKVCRLTSDEIELLKSRGIPFKCGRWSKREDDKLTENYTNFTSQFKFNDPYSLLGIGQDTKHNNKTVSDFIKAKHFYLRLGEGLGHRPLYSIYGRARRLFNPMRNMPKFNKRDVSELTTALQLFGNKWNKVAKSLHRSAENCREAFRWHKSPIEKGSWTPEEHDKLISAIKTVTGLENPLANKIPWNKIAELVKTRNSSQCRFRFFGQMTLNSKVSKEIWNKFSYAKLIKILKNECITKEETNINWDKVHAHFPNILSYLFLQSKWRYLKSKVPAKFKQNVADTMDFLSKLYKLENEEPLVEI